MINNDVFYESSTVAEVENGIILASYQKKFVIEQGYQTEAQLEEKLICDLMLQGYERKDITTPEELDKNLRVQIERLNKSNKVTFTDAEWERFKNEYLDSPNDGIIEKTRKIQDNHIYDFLFDDGHIENIKIIDKKNIHNNHLQVINQVTQKGELHSNRYDVTILVNGLPLVHIELKKRGVNLQEAFNQIHRYSKESFNSENSLYKYVQIFVISNGTFTRYFANTTANDKNNYNFTCEWADAKNKTINELEDFTATFLQKRTIIELLTKYCIFDVNNILLVMRPYQIAATERILQKIITSYHNNTYGKREAGGYIWHTTGSGKTLTSFKAARLAKELPFIDKVFFVVDRKDLDNQTIKEYERFQKGSVNGSVNTRELKRVIEKDDDKIVVTTIQKLNEFVKTNPEHPIYKKHCVLIFDECHRSQFGESKENIRKKFKKYYQFGFTGTPIFPENASGEDTTESVFGKRLHSYIITDAIRDEKVLKFRVDYNNSNAVFKAFEEEKDENKLKVLEKKELLHPKRIEAITEHILKVYNIKTHRDKQYSVQSKKLQGFNAMFAVENIDAAKLYYEEFKRQQKDLPEEKKLKVATIFSFSANEEQKSLGEISDEDFSPENLDLSSKEFLDRVISEYNSTFATNFSTAGNGFQNYYKDLSQRVKNKDVDLVIVVGMLLTGFDAPTLNTLFVDKNLRYHGLIQAFSRTNRILNKVKTFGNIVCFRNLEENTEEAIKMFGDGSDSKIILERSYEEYLNGFEDEETGKQIIGYKEICRELIEKFPNPEEIVLEKDKKEFVKLFGELLKRENILRNYEAFQKFEKIISDRQMQDMKSVYVDIREEIMNRKAGEEKEGEIDFSDVEFQIELLKTQEINLEYIFSLIFKKVKEYEDINTLKDEVRSIIRSSLGTRAKEELIMEFINQTDLSKMKDIDDVILAFSEYAKKEKEKEISELIKEEKLKEESETYINRVIEKGHIDITGTELTTLLPPTSRRKGAREAKKQIVFDKIKKLVEVFKEIKYK